MFSGDPFVELGLLKKSQDLGFDILSHRIPFLSDFDDLRSVLVLIDNFVLNI